MLGDNGGRLWHCRRYPRSGDPDASRLRFCIERYQASSEFRHEEGVILSRCGGQKGVYGGSETTQSLGKGR